MAGYGIENSYLELYDTTFHSFLRQQGSALMLATTFMDVAGDVKYVNKYDVGPAHWIDSKGSITEYTTQKYDRRRLKPRAFECTLSLDEIDMIKQGIPHVDKLASNLAYSCGDFLDDIIIKGLGGTSFTESEGEKVLPGAKEAGITNGDDTAEKCVAKYDTTQTISWNDCSLGAEGNSLSVMAGLNSSKIAKAVQKLRSKHNNGRMIVCVTNSYGASTAQADNRIASTDFNTQQSLANGFLTPYGGCNAFLTSERLDTGKSAVAANGHGTNNVTGVTVRYAYMFAVDNIILGCSLPLSLKNGVNVERNFAQVLSYRGMYDCTRLFEESVVRIEILENTNGVTKDSFVK